MSKLFTYILITFFLVISSHQVFAWQKKKTNTKAKITNTAKKKKTASIKKKKSSKKKQAKKSRSKKSTTAKINKPVKIEDIVKQVPLDIPVMRTPCGPRNSPPHLAVSWECSLGYRMPSKDSDRACNLFNIRIGSSPLIKFFFTLRKLNLLLCAAL